MYLHHLKQKTNAFLKTLLMAASGHVGDSPLFLLDYLIRFLRVAALLAIWQVILGGRGEVFGMTLAAVQTYTLVAEVFAEPLACRTELGLALWEGTIATRMLQPLSLPAQFAADSAGRWLFGLVFFGLPLFLGAPLLGVNPLPADPGAGVLFLISLLLSLSVGLALEFLFGAYLVCMDQEYWSMQQVRNATTTLLTGALLPFALLPWGLGRIFEWLPFAAMASAPLRIYVGTGNPWLLLGQQALWAVLLWPLAGALWRGNREKLVCHGG